MTTTADLIRAALTDDICNLTDGAGSDLEIAEDIGDDTFIEVHGNLDVSALANTVLRLIEENKE